MLKKIEFLIPDLLSSYIKTNFPTYVQFLTLFGKFLDQNSFGKIFHIDENLDPYQTYSELLDLFLDEIFTQAFDFDVYALTDDNKKRFIDLAEKINGLKGNKQAFAVFFQSLTNFRFATESGTINIDNFGSVNFSESDLPEDILQYYFSVVITSVEGFESLIDNVHPAGMLYNISGALYDGTYDHDAVINYRGEII